MLFLVIMKIKSAIKNVITIVTSPHSDLDNSITESTETCKPK